MNFYKHLLRKYRYFRILSLNNICLTNHVKNHQTRNFFTNSKHCLNDDPELEETTGIYPYYADTQFNATWKTLFNDNSNPRIMEIVKCASIKDVFNFVRNNVDNLNDECLTQIILSLHNLQSIFFYHCESEVGDKEVKQQFLNKLMENQEFYMVTEKIENNLSSFNPVLLSYSLQSLHRLGISEEDRLIQNIALKLRDHLLKELDLGVAAKLFKVIFAEQSVRPYYTVLDLVPKIFEQIEQIENEKDLNNLSLCLYKLNNILTEDILSRFEQKVNQFIQTKRITDANYELILGVITLFNVQKWRSRFCLTISKCIMLMEPSIDKLNLSQIHLLYDIFFRNEEPGDALNTIQRAAAKLLHELDETEPNQHNKLKLFSSVIYFSSPINKEQFRQHVGNYIERTESVKNMTILRKIYSYLRVSDPNIWEAYWNKACQVLKHEKDIEKCLSFIENYIYFCNDMPGFRHFAFEHYVSSLIQKHINEGTLTLYPNRFFSFLASGLICCNNFKLIASILELLPKLSCQLTSYDVHKLSYVIQVIQQRRSLVTSSQIDSLSKLLHKETGRMYANVNLDPGQISLLIKSSVYRKDFNNNGLIEDMLTSLKESKLMSSKLIESICFSLYSTSFLIPEVINLCTNYVIHYKSYIIGFNAEKILYLLYRLNYQPVYEDEFFPAVVDIILRDQERLSGLGFLQSALALCFFHRIPNSFVKQIFNVEFLDKIDVELVSCYSKDKYPYRVRNILMQLNRAVCLEYPQYNIPWFHQKYIEEYQKNNAIDDVSDAFHRSVKAYLQGILGSSGTFSENVRVPYGYDIDFVFYLDANKKLTNEIEDAQTIKQALLLLPDHSFTRLYVRLKGSNAQKVRHLEILGYKVKIIKWNEWSNLLYAKERVDYIKQIVFT